MPSQYELPYVLKPDLDHDNFVKAVARNMEHLSGQVGALQRMVAGLRDELAGNGEDLRQQDVGKQGNESSGGDQLGDDESLWGVGVDAGILAISKTSAVVTTIPASPSYDLYNATVAPNTYTFLVDRPMNVFMFGYAIVQNTSGTPHGARLAFRVTDPGSATYDGDPSANWQEADSHNRIVVNIRTFTAFDPGEYLVQWGLQSDAGGYAAQVGDRKVLLFMSYAPNATAQETPGDPNWTADPANVAGYGRNV